MTLRSDVLSEFERVAQEHGIRLAPLTDEMVLLDLGIDSICFAIIIAHLEDRLGVDPFANIGKAQYPITIGDFIRFYEDALT